VDITPCRRKTSNRQQNGRNPKTFDTHKIVSIAKSFVDLGGFPVHADLSVSRYPCIRLWFLASMSPSPYLGLLRFLASMSPSPYLGIYVSVSVSWHLCLRLRILASLYPSLVLSISVSVSGF
jgi:hypothetical protein